MNLMLSMSVLGDFISQRRLTHQRCLLVFCRDVCALWLCTFAAAADALTSATPLIMYVGLFTFNSLFPQRLLCAPICILNVPAGFYCII